MECVSEGALFRAPSAIESLYILQYVPWCIISIESLC